MADQNFSLHSGDSKSVAVNIVNSAGVAVDVSTAAAVVYKLAQSPTSEPVVTKGLGSGVSVAGAVVTVTFAPGDTADLYGLWFQELQVTDGAGNVATVLTGYVLVENDLYLMTTLTGILDLTVTLSGVIDLFVEVEPGEPGVPGSPMGWLLLWTYP